MTILSTNGLSPSSAPMAGPRRVGGWGTPDMAVPYSLFDVDAAPSLVHNVRTETKHGAFWYMVDGLLQMQYSNIENFMHSISHFRFLLRVLDKHPRSDRRDSIL